MSEIRGLLSSDSGADRPAYHSSEDSVTDVPDTRRHAQGLDVDDSERQVLQQAQLTHLQGVLCSMLLIRVKLDTSEMGYAGSLPCIIGSSS